MQARSSSHNSYCNDFVTFTSITDILSKFITNILIRSIDIQLLNYKFQHKFTTIN